jgi:hypothetical protein
MTKKSKVLAALQTGQQLTAKQIAARFSAGNPREIIRSLRAEGVCIYANAKTNSKGDRNTFYRIGTPNRKMVAAAYALLGADAV